MVMICSYYVLALLWFDKHCNKAATEGVGREALARLRTEGTSRRWQYVWRLDLVLSAFFCANYIDTKCQKSNMSLAIG